MAMAFQLGPCRGLPEAGPECLLPYPPEDHSLRVPCPALRATWPQPSHLLCLVNDACPQGRLRCHLLDDASYPSQSSPFPTGFGAVYPSVLSASLPTLPQLPSLSTAPSCPGWAFALYPFVFMI